MGPPVHAGPSAARSWAHVDASPCEHGGTGADRRPSFNKKPHPITANRPRPKSLDDEEYGRSRCWPRRRSRCRPPTRIGGRHGGHGSRRTDEDGARAAGGSHIAPRRPCSRTRSGPATRGSGRRRADSVKSSRRRPRGARRPRPRRWPWTRPARRPAAPPAHSHQVRTAPRGHRGPQYDVRRGVPVGSGRRRVHVTRREPALRCRVDS